jgi:hypothetical protein
MLKPFLVRLPNEVNYEEIKLDLDFFNLTSESSDEVHGHYKGMYIFIKKDENNFNTRAVYASSK